MNEGPKMVKGEEILESKTWDPNDDSEKIVMASAYGASSFEHPEDENVIDAEFTEIQESQNKEDSYLTEAGKLVSQMSDGEVQIAMQEAIEKNKMTLKELNKKLWEEERKAFQKKKKKRQTANKSRKINRRKK